MKKIAYTLLAAVAIVACSSPEGNSLEAKKKELEDLNKQIAELQTQAKNLEMEILEMDSSGSTGKLVAVQTLSSSSFESYVSLEGVVDAEESTLATAQVPGLITQVLVKAGQRVTKGQTLALLDQSTLNKSRVELQQKLEFATTVFDKQARLWSQGIGTEIQYLNAKNQKESLENALETMSAQMDLYRIKSPINGTVEVADVKVGQSVAPGLPLFRVVNLSRSMVKASVSENYSNLIKQGAEVYLQFPDLGTEWHKANIDFVSKFIDPLNRTFGVEIYLNGVSIAQQVKPNMIAKLRISEYKNAKAMAVPSNCIQYNDETAFIVTAEQKGNQAIARICSVTTGKSSDGLTELIEGQFSDSTTLSEGMKVITAGFQELNEGQFIEISKR